MWANAEVRAKWNRESLKTYSGNKSQDQCLVEEESWIDMGRWIPQLTWLLSATNISPSVGSNAISAGLVRLDPRTTACHRPSSSNTSIFCPTASATYSLSPTQSTASATGAHDADGTVMSFVYWVTPAGAFSACEWIWKIRGDDIYFIILIFINKKTIHNIC